MDFAQVLNALIAAGFPALAVLASILLLFLGLTIRVVRWLEKNDGLKESIEGVKQEQKDSEKRIKEQIKSEAQRLDGRIDEANRQARQANRQAREANRRIDGTNRRIDETNTRIDGTNTRIDNVSQQLNVRIDHVSMQLANGSGQVPSPRKMAQGESPEVLNEMGKETAKRLKLREMLERVYPEIKDKFVTGKHDNAYDIQLRIHSYFRWEIEKHWTPQELKVLKDEAYIKMYGVEELYYIMGLLCRDKVLADYGIKIEPASLRPQDKYLPASGGSPVVAKQLEQLPPAAEQGSTAAKSTGANSPVVISENKPAGNAKPANGAETNPAVGAAKPASADTA